MQAENNKKNPERDYENMITAVLRENEKRANRMAVYIFITGIFVVALSLLLNELGIFRLKTTVDFSAHLIPGAVSLVPVVAYLSGRCSQQTLKWINLSCIIAFSAWLNFSFSYYAPLCLAFPIVLAVAYFSERTTVITYIVTVVAFGISTYAGSFAYALLDANHVSVPEGTMLTVGSSLKQTLSDAGFRNAQYTEHMMMYSFVPTLIISLLMIVLAIAITRFGYDMLIRQAKNTAAKVKADAELKLAGDLQASALPQTSSLNGKYHFEIAASMTPAREACGDFYDFVMIDETHLALVMADVCGKGIPAAMFMMSVREKLHSAFAPGKAPGGILFEVNNSLFENNTKKMFVTVWLGIIDIANGRMLSANAGHEDPILRKASGRFEVRKETHGIVLGVRKDREYPDHELQLDPGDILVQYTDGVTEARNESGEMYGTERLLAGLNEKRANEPGSAENINTGIWQQVSDFVGGAEQTDDITTLVFRYL